MKPSNFTSHPYGSILQNSESETVARNIMLILKRTGDTWRELSWEEYFSERVKDSMMPEREQYYFNKVIKYCKSSDTAELFASGWKKPNDGSLI